MRLQAGRIRAIEKRAAEVTAPDPRFLAVLRLADGTYLEGSSGRSVSAAEVDAADRSGGLVVVLATPPEGMELESVATPC